MKINGRDALFLDCFFRCERRSSEVVESREKVGGRFPSSAEREAASGRLLSEPGLEVKLQSELKDARVANGAGIDAE